MILMILTRDGDFEFDQKMNNMVTVLWLLFYFDKL